MYTDFTRLMVPAQLRDAMVDQTRRAMSFQKQVVDWQLAQVQAAAKTSEKQAHELFELGLENTRKSIEAVRKLQEDTLSAWAPADKAEA